MQHRVAVLALALALFQSKLPPAEWIAYTYHGLVLDANLEEIPLDDKNVNLMLESFYAVLAPKSDKYEKPFFDPSLDPKQRLAVRTAVLDQLFRQATPVLREKYYWRYDRIRRADLFNNPDISEMLRRMGIPLRVFPETEYVRTCRAQRVPIPPNWPDARWVKQGPLPLVFVSARFATEVDTYRDKDVDGVCYALPRRDDSGAIHFLGVICQSTTTGKACFWDNVLPDNATRLQAFDINQVANGSNLRENCTLCHRGDNAFNIHPATALDLSRADVIAGPYTTTPRVRYAPIGQAEWINPRPLSLPAPPVPQRSCTGCHTLPDVGPLYCESVLRRAARSTMPPFEATHAGWPPEAIRGDFDDHIRRLASLCPPAP